MQGLRGIFETDDEGRLALRTLGGVLLGTAMLLIFIRRSAFGDPWGDFALLLVLLAPCVLLYGAALLGYLSFPEGRVWESTYAVFGILLIPLVLFQFVELVNGNTGAPLNTAWIFLVTAVAAVVATLVGTFATGSWPLRSRSSSRGWACGTRSSPTVWSGTSGRSGGC